MSEGPAKVDQLKNDVIATGLMNVVAKQLEKQKNPLGIRPRLIASRMADYMRTSGYKYSNIAGWQAPVNSVKVT